MKSPLTIFRFCLRILKPTLNAFILILFSAGVLSSSASAGDKVGNGGGIWSCENSKGELIDLMFMDIFEGRREYLLTIPELPGSFLEGVQNQKSWIAANLPFQAKLLPHINYVELNITWIADIITTIPDAANKIIPHPSLCKGGTWQAVQLVNFTDDFRILVRRELFESSLITELERAAVYLHEGIYSYLRTEFGDPTSVRARAIVGILFSDLADKEKVRRIQGIMDQNPTIVEPPPSKGTWVCGIIPSEREPLYIFEAAKKEKAIEGAVGLCKKDQNPFGDNGIGGGGFFPFPMPGPGMNCKETKVICEQVTSQQPTKTCQMKDFFDEKTFVGSGKTFLEAQKEMSNQCLLQGRSTSSCYDFRKMTCKGN